MKTNFSTKEEYKSRIGEIEKERQRLHKEMEVCNQELYWVTKKLQEICDLPEEERYTYSGTPYDGGETICTYCQKEL